MKQSCFFSLILSTYLLIIYLSVCLSSNHLFIHQQRCFITTFLTFIYVQCMASIRCILNKQIYIYIFCVSVSMLFSEHWILALNEYQIDKIDTWCLLLHLSWLLFYMFFNYCSSAFQICNSSSGTDLSPATYVPNGFIYLGQQCWLPTLRWQWQSLIV